MLRIHSLLFIFVIVVGFQLELDAQGAKPLPPGTGARSVQMFQGKTQNLWIAVYPPKTYSDGSPIKPGTPVKIRVYRSYDGGKTFGSRVTVVSGGSGFAGQGKSGSRKKPWIDLKLSVPVENRAPYLVVLGVTSVVGKEESAINSANLTFRYFPSLKIYGSPSEASNKDDSSTKGKSGPLQGTWNLDGQGSMVIHESGRKVSGTITAEGQRVATLSGTRNGNRYSLSLVLTYEGKKYNASVDLTVAQNGKGASGTASANGESIPLKFKINGRTLSAG